MNRKASLPFEVNINHDMTIDAAKKIGCQIVNIGATDLSAGTPHLVLGVLWQIIKVTAHAHNATRAVRTVRIVRTVRTVREAWQLRRAESIAEKRFLDEPCAARSR
jgi:hypothetical protein